MWKYVLKRILWMVVIMLCVTVVIFTITYFTPGNPARVLMGNSAREAEVAAKAAQLGIDKPFLVQMANYFNSVYLHGDFGVSWSTNSRVLDTIIERLPVTIIIGGLAMLLQVIIGVPLGVLAAINQGKWQDYFSISLSLLLVSLPDFWVALMAVIIFRSEAAMAAGVGNGHLEMLCNPHYCHRLYRYCTKRPADPLLHAGGFPR